MIFYCDICNIICIIILIIYIFVILYVNVKKLICEYKIVISLRKILFWRNYNDL